MALIESLFNHDWTLTRRTRTADGQGGYTQTWATVATVAGRMRPASAAERTLAMQRRADISHVWYVAADEEVQRGDRITGQGRTYDVIAIREPSHAAHHLEVECFEWQQEGQP